MVYRPIPIDKEITFSKKKFIVSKTDVKGNILFVNKNLCDISGYTEEELIGTSHSILRHPDMPRAIFFLVWSSLLRGEPVSGVVKNLAKSGEYYWVIVDFEIKKEPDGAIKSFTAFRRAAPQHVIDEIEDLYEAMLKIERKHGMEGSLSYLEAFLEEKGMNYDDYLTHLVESKGFLSKLFGGFKNLLD